MPLPICHCTSCRVFSHNPLVAFTVPPAPCCTAQGTSQAPLVPSSSNPPANNCLSPPLQPQTQLLQSRHCSEHRVAPNPLPLPLLQTSSPGCRRSSSDIVHESGAKAQRECRLRPHFSDPMPTDSVKRKQLELKIAAAARQHAQKRRQERDYGTHRVHCQGGGRWARC